MRKVVAFVAVSSFVSSSAFATDPLLLTAPCGTSADLIAQGVVRPLPKDAHSLALEFVAAGLRITDAWEVRWPEKCQVSIQRVSHGWGVIDQNVAIQPSAGRLVTSDPKTVTPALLEPAHPFIPNTEFSSSYALLIDNWRVGLWQEPTGRSIIAAYRPGETAAPRQIILSAKPVIGISYLASPDSSGGAYFLWQKVSAGNYRVITVQWNEEAVRSR
ncbi:hypothetical protein [Acetobacter sp.]|uniref:hypothetical protein n=1 Tax=Acetobacter sp. TaxID=440 RepID=UPI0039E97E09